MTRGVLNKFSGINVVGSIDRPTLSREITKSGLCGKRSTINRWNSYLFDYMQNVTWVQNYNCTFLSSHHLCGKMLWKMKVFERLKNH